MSDKNVINNAASLAITGDKFNDLFSQGDILYWKCEYEKASEHFQSILNQSSTNLIESARCYNSLGATNAKLKNFEEALNNYHKQLDILSKLETSEKRTTDTVKCYTSIGKVCCLKLDYAAAIDYYKRALDLVLTITPATDLISNIYKDLANLYTKTQEFDLATECFTKALEIDHQQIKQDHPKFGQTYANMGTMYYRRKDYKEALYYFLKAHEIWEKSLTPRHIYTESMNKTIHKVQLKLNEPFAPQYKGHLKTIHTQLISLQTVMEPGWSVELYDSEKLYSWKLVVEGPVGTPYENGHFQLTLNFPSAFPFKQPEVFFNTKIFHPNISSNGRICNALLMDDTWTPGMNIRTILKHIQKLLANPNFDDFIFPEAAFLFKEDRAKFHQKAVEWTRIYASEGAQSGISEASSSFTSSESSSASEKSASNTEQVSLSEAATAERVLWLWKFISHGKTEWHRFWDIEIAILDKAYLNSEKGIELDDCIVNFDQGWRLNKNDETKTDVIRSSFNREHKAQIRKKWMVEQQLTENATFYSDTSNNKNSIISKCLSLDASISVVVNGIRNEGKIIGKPIEADFIVKELELAASNDNSLFGLQCIHQYTRSSFLNISLNKFLCNNDFSKVQNLGPYLKLLFLHFKEYPIYSNEMTVYRGVNLSSEDLHDYQQAIDKGTFRWFGFTSTSKSRKVAEFYDANTLMIISLNKRYPTDGRAVDIGVLSQFPEEEEVLLRADVQFCVEKVELDKEKTKHLIYIQAYV